MGLLPFPLCSIKLSKQGTSSVNSHNVLLRYPPLSQVLGVIYGRSLDVPDPLASALSPVSTSEPETSSARGSDGTTPGPELGEATDLLRDSSGEEGRGERGSRGVLWPALGPSPPALGCPENSITTAKWASTSARIMSTQRYQYHYQTTELEVLDELETVRGRLAM